MSYDVIVCGGGTAGSVAAIAAARRGVKTLIVEQFGFLGGSQTAALVLPLMSYSTGGEKLVLGICEEINQRCNDLPGDNEGMFFNPELLKYVLEEMVLEAGCDLSYHTYIIGATVRNGALRSIEVAGKSGRRELEAKQFIDCTGDADVAYLSGAPFESGRPEDGLNQSASLRFTVGGVDLERLAAFLREKGGLDAHPPRFGWGFAKGGVGDKGLGALMEQAEQDGVFTAEEGGYIQFFTIPGRPGELGFNCPRITHVNGARDEDLTRAQVQGRRIIPRIMEFCRRYLDGFDDAYLAQTAPMVGIRESRRIVGEYVLSAEDFRQARKFEDGIAKSCYPIDIHNPSGVGVTLERLGPGEYHEIPYRCLVPLCVDNLLVAGRCISATFEAQAAIRIEATCRAMGEAAGVAAALCVRHGVTPRALSSDLLLAALRENGANVHAPEET
ncbi:MAG: FAD-dependent oxidoreductase [Armatimonadetes bacterium]|nr:FAD-dependent oxidoreductase [Armatimonadota bacterium]